MPDYVLVWIFFPLGFAGGVVLARAVSRSMDRRAGRKIARMTHDDDPGLPPQAWGIRSDGPA